MRLLLKYNMQPENNKENSWIHQTTIHSSLQDINFYYREKKKKELKHAEWQCFPDAKHNISYFFGIFLS